RFSRDWSSDVCSSDLIERISQKSKKLQTENLDLRNQTITLLNKRFEEETNNMLAFFKARSEKEEELRKEHEEHFEKEEALLKDRSEERRVGKECRYRW